MRDRGQEVDELRYVIDFPALDRANEVDQALVEDRNLLIEEIQLWLDRLQRVGDRTQDGADILADEVAEIELNVVQRNTRRARGVKAAKIERPRGLPSTSDQQLRRKTRVGIVNRIGPRVAHLPHIEPQRQIQINLSAAAKSKVQIGKVATLHRRDGHHRDTADRLTSAAAERDIGPQPDKRRRRYIDGVGRIHLALTRCRLRRGNPEKPELRDELRSGCQGRTDADLQFVGTGGSRDISADGSIAIDPEIERESP